MLDNMDSIMEIERRTKKVEISSKGLAGMIDHTNLSPYATAESIKGLCGEAETYGFHSVCVNPYWTQFCAKELEATEVKVDTAIGFPLGQITPEEKAFEACQAVGAGASEVDMVMNVGAFRNGDIDIIMEEIGAVVKEVEGAIVKVILETGYLTHEQITKACRLVKEAGADFVKNSTGFGPLGATVVHTSLMREAVGSNFGVKAAGGIKDFRNALRMIAAGADRIGASAGAEIMESYEKSKDIDWIIEENPCRLCPTYNASFEKMPPSTSEYYRKKCRDCPYEGSSQIRE